MGDRNVGALNRAVPVRACSRGPGRATLEPETDLPVYAVSPQTGHCGFRAMLMV